MKKLTQREKLLIYILICFVIVSGGIYFVVLPSYARYAAISDQAAEAAFTQESMAMSIESIPATMTTRDEAQSKLTTLKNPFSAPLPNEGLDVLLTQLCLSCNLTPTMLSIEENAEQDVPRFVGGTTGAEAMLGSGSSTTSGSSTGSTTGSGSTTNSNLTTATDSSGTTTTGNTGTSTSSSSLTGTNSTSSSGSSTGTSSTGTSSSGSSTSNTTDESDKSNQESSGASTWTGVVTMEMTGTQADFYRLLDTVAARTDMIVADFELSPKAATTSTTTTSSTAATQGLNGGTVSIKVTFNVYMMDK
jgi:hypothetical protein